MDTLKKMDEDISYRLDKIEEKLDRILEKLDAVDQSAKKMDEHIEFVEGYVNIMPSCTTIKRLMGNVLRLPFTPLLIKKESPRRRKSY